MANYRPTNMRQLLMRKRKALIDERKAVNFALRETMRKRDVLGKQIEVQKAKMAESVTEVEITDKGHFMVLRELISCAMLMNEAGYDHLQIELISQGKGLAAISNDPVFNGYISLAAKLKDL